ncbi:MAG: hypothetical protein KGZ61_10155 [Sandarakinorhabdus sp.]|nr:hypothetical protein [Sandarakinorhabdus sp.]
MSSYRDHFAGHLRLTILRVLGEAPEYTLNADILRMSAEQVGIPATRDLIETSVEWLAEQGLVQLERLSRDIIVASATARGLDVAAGRALVPGVARPGPKG